MSDARSPSQQISDEVGAWPGVKAAIGTRGELAFKLDHREIGHLHGDRSAHFFFPRGVWSELMMEGRIAPHPVFPDKQGPASRRISSAEDIEDVIALMRLNYDRVTAAHPLAMGAHASS